MYVWYNIVTYLVIRFDGWVTELADPIKMKEINNQQSNGRCGLG